MGRYLVIYDEDSLEQWHELSQEKFRWLDGKDGSSGESSSSEGAEQTVATAAAAELNSTGGGAAAAGLAARAGGVSVAEAAAQWSWVACDKCNQWRRLPRSLGISIGDRRWTCKANPNPKYKRCTVEQELSDEAIDREIALGDQVLAKP